MVIPYQELIIDIRQTGGNWWAKYSVDITPNEDSIWIVSLIDNGENKQSYHDGIFYQGIKSGLTEFIEQQEKRGVDLGGINFRITNHSYHSVDSKPAAFKYTLIGLLNRLEKTNHFQKTIIKPELSSTFFNVQEISFDQNKAPYILTETHFQIPTPRNFEETINLTKCIKITINDLREKRLTFKIILSPKPYQKQKNYFISVELRDEVDSNKISIFSNKIAILNDQINQVLKTLRHNKYNLSGLDILVIPLYDEAKEPFIKSNIEYIKWPILNVLLDPRNAEIENEPYY